MKQPWRIWKLHRMNLRRHNVITGRRSKAKFYVNLPEYIVYQMMSHNMDMFELESKLFSRMGVTQTKT